MNTFIPLHANTLMREQRADALTSLMFLTKKRDGTIKTRNCADGRPQHQHIAKEETTSPTVSNDSIFAIAAINAHEHRCVGSANLHGAFLNAYNNDLVIMKVVRKLAELMVKTAHNLY